MKMEELFILIFIQSSTSSNETNSLISFSMLQTTTTKTMEKSTRDGSELELQMMCLRETAPMP
jgi:hypothetical protein